MGVNASCAAIVAAHITVNIIDDILNVVNVMVFIYVSMAADGIDAENVEVVEFVSMVAYTINAEIVEVPPYSVNTTANATSAASAGAPPYVTTIACVLIAKIVGAPPFVSTVSGAVGAESATQGATFEISLRPVSVALSAPTRIGARSSISVARSLPSVGTSSNSSSPG